MTARHCLVGSPRVLGCKAADSDSIVEPEARIQVTDTKYSGFKEQRGVAGASKANSDVWQPRTQKKPGTERGSEGTGGMWVK